MVSFTYVYLHCQRNEAVAKNKRKMKTQITRDTNYSFLKTTTKEDGSSFTRKLEKGTADYSNASMNFHMKGITLEVGNSITK